MADNSDDIVLQISTDMSTIKRQLRQLGQDITAATNQWQKSFEKGGASIDKAFMPSSAVQKRINEFVGITEKAGKQWSGVLADQGKEMDRLRAKYNPIFAVVTKYKASVADIQMAHKVGALSATEMTAALDRERTAALADIAAIKGRNAALADTPVMRGIGKGANTFNTANIAAQFQDIAVMTQMGIANPLTIALQQGTQLSAVFNQMGGTKEVIRGIGAAFLSLINPVSLVTVGTIAAGVAAYNYFSATKDGAADTEKALKEQADLIDRVAKKWGDALPAIRAYANEKERLEGKADIEQATQNEIAKVFKDIGVEVSSAGNSINDVMDLVRNMAPPDQLVAMQGAFKTLTETAAENKTTVEEMEAAQRAALDLYRSTGIPVFKETADAIGELIPRLETTNAEVARLAESDAAAQAINNLQAAIGNINSAKARDELDDLLKKAREGEISVADLLSELGRISGYAPDVSGIISAFRAVAEAANAARAAASFTGQESQGGRVRYHSGAFMQLPGSNAPTPTEAPNREDVGAENDRRAAAAARRGGGSRAPRRTADDRFFEDIEAIRQRTIALAEEAKMVGMGYEAQTKRKIAFDLEQKALKDVREEARKKGDQDWQNAQLTPDQVAKINEVSEAYAAQAENLRLVREAQAEYEDWMNLGRDATRGFIQDLIEGKSAGEAFANVLSKIADKLLDMAMNDLWGGSGGGGGLIGSLLGGIFGGGGGADPWGGLRANGGPVQAGKAYIVGEKRPELFVPNQSGTIVPQVPVMPTIQATGAGSSVVVNFNPVIDNRGASVEAVARTQQQLDKLKAQLPSIVTQSVRQANKSNVKF